MAEKKDFEKMTEVPLSEDDIGESNGISSETEERHKLMSKRTLALIVYVICTIGCAYQMIEVLILYFKYETTTTLTIRHPDEMNPPSISICFPYLSMIKFDQLVERYPEFTDIIANISAQTSTTVDIKTYRMKNFKRNDFDRKMIPIVYDKLTIGEIISLTTSLEEFFDECVAKSPKTSNIVEHNNVTGCEEVWKMDYFVKDESKCFLFEFRNAPDKDYVYKWSTLANSHSYRTTIGFLRFYPAVLTENVEKGYVYFHQRGRLPYGRSNYPLTLKQPAKDVLYSLTYAYTKSKRLESPYESDCKDYNKEGLFESRDECIENCTMTEAYAKYKKVPFNLVFGKNSTFKLISYDEIDGSEDIYTYLRKVVDDCRAKCKNEDCETETYEPNFISSENGTRLKFGLELPYAMDTITELNPKMDFIEYLIYNFSVFGFWFGLCVLQLSDMFEYLYKKPIKTVVRLAKLRSKDAADVL